MLKNIKKKKCKFNFHLKNNKIIRVDLILIQKINQNLKRRYRL